MQQQRLRRLVQACGKILAATDVFSSVIGRSSKEDVRMAQKQVERLFKCVKRGQLLCRQTRAVAFPGSLSPMLVRCRGRKKSAMKTLREDVQRVLCGLPDMVRCTPARCVPR